MSPSPFTSNSLNAHLICSSLNLLLLATRAHMNQLQEIPPLLSMSSFAKRDLTWSSERVCSYKENPLRSQSMLMTPSLLESKLWNKRLSYFYSQRLWRWREMQARADIWNRFITLKLESLFSEILLNYLFGVTCSVIFTIHGCWRASSALSLDFMSFCSIPAISYLHYAEILSQGSELNRKAPFITFLIVY